ADIFVDALDHDLDLVVLMRHREGRDLVAVAVEPFRALARPVDAPGDQALAACGLGRQPHVVDRMTRGLVEFEVRGVVDGEAHGWCQSSRNWRPISSDRVAMSPRTPPRNFLRPASNT